MRRRASNYHVIHCNTVQHYATQYNAMLGSLVHYTFLRCYKTVPCNTMPYTAVQCGTRQDNANARQFSSMRHKARQCDGYNVLYCNPMQYIAECNTMQYNAMPHNAMSYSTTLVEAIHCHTVPCHAIQCNTMQYNTT